MNSRKKKFEEFKELQEFRTASQWKDAVFPTAWFSIGDYNRSCTDKSEPQLGQTDSPSSLLRHSELLQLLELLELLFFAAILLCSETSP